jgi:hypothetical protein
MTMLTLLIGVFAVAGIFVIAALSYRTPRILK